MTYQLKEITPTDQERIISDVSPLNGAREILSYQKDQGLFPKSWLIDSTGKNYLMEIQPIVRPESTGRDYVFHTQQCTLQIHIPGWFGMQIEFANDIVMSNEAKKRATQEITLALSVLEDKKR